MTTISLGQGGQGFQVGVNHGMIHIPPHRPETPPAPLSTVPFRRNPDFVSRDTLLDEIHTKISVPGSRIALVGIGGVGKSQLGIEYTHRVRSQSPATWVFWVHASNAARFEESFADIARSAKIPGRNDPMVNIFRLVESWLQDAKRGRWLLILDNIDDDGLLRQPFATGQQRQINGQNPSTKPLLEFIPRSPHGSIIITSRNRELALKIVDHRNIIRVEPMKRSEALVLLQKKLELPEETQEAVKLVEELEFLPLAIVQAAGYIKHRAPRFSVSQYLKLFQESDRRATRLLSFEASFDFPDWEAENSILVTLQISFAHIQKSRPSAADLLSLMSFFDPQGISEELLLAPIYMKSKSTPSLPQDVAESSSPEDSDSSSEPDLDTFIDDITTLRDYSFIHMGTDSTVFTMHRLVQLTVRAWLKTYGKLEQWKECFIHNLRSNFPKGKFENWTRCQVLYAHVQCAIAQKPCTVDSLQEWASLLHEAASFTWTRGNFDESKRMAEKAMKTRTKIFGLENEETLDSLEMLGLAYSLGGQWNMAQELHIQVMETCKRILGLKHPSTLTSMANLASTYRNQGRWKEAEELELQAIEIRKQVLGLEHPDTLISMANLASTYGGQGRWKEAKELELQVMRTRRHLLGIEHPDTLTSMANLALTYWNQGRWKDAERLGVQVIESRKQVLGPKHPSTLTSMANLASTYWDQGRWTEAEQLGMQVIEIRKQVLGPEHPDTLTSMANLASTYGDQGRWKEAEELEINVLEARKRVLGLDHPDTLTSMANLASTYGDQGRLEEAKELELLVIQTSKQVLGPEHPDTLTSMANLASTYGDQGRWDAAEELGLHVLKARKKVLGPEHPDTLTSMANLASTYGDQGRWKEAKELELQVMETRRQVLGPEHTDTLASMANLAYTLRSSGRNEDTM
ncbi:hypothetical protein N7507_003346 [Penicillium longicatenatum]|nr:hypothetical protein N7507_003346 [Penicillium longicatenatum]